MSNRGTPLIDGTYANFQAAVLKQLPREIDPNIMDDWISNQENLRRTLHKALVPELVVPDINWRQVYKQLGLLTELEQYLALDATCGTSKEKTWVIPVLKEITHNKLLEAYSQLGVAYHLWTEDLDGVVATSERDPKDGSYTVCFKQAIETDSEFVSKSVDDLKLANIKSITLLEFLLLNLGYFLMTRKHLSNAGGNITVCAGSRYTDTYTPDVYWHADNRKLIITSTRHDSRSSQCGFRAVVS